MLEEGFLKVSNTHSIYYATYGNKNGVPILFIHGGPGGYSNANKQLEDIDTNKFYIILYDQRGCGRSIPSGEIKENTTQDAVEDIRKILDKLEINKVCIAASSWGACLGLIFAESYPERVLRMFLRSTFLARRKDSQWLYNGSRSIFPDIYEKYIADLLPENYNIDNVAKYLLNKMEQSSFDERRIIACAMANYEYALMLMVFSNSTFKKPEDLDEADINATKIFLHYESNYFFIDDNYIINNSLLLKDIPISFYHGRFDMDCTIDGVYKLHKKLLNSKLTIVPYESHSGSFMKELQKNDIKDLY